MIGVAPSYRLDRTEVERRKNAGGAGRVKENCLVIRRPSGVEGMVQRIRGDRFGGVSSSEANSAMTDHA